MGPADEKRLQQNIVEIEKKAAERTKTKAEIKFEKLKNEAEEKMGKKQSKEMTDDDMLEWIELNKQLQVSRETGKPYLETAADKFKRKFGENPFIPIGKH